MELQVIQSKIYWIRGLRVMLDFDLAGMYQVETRVLNQSVKRNKKRFPSDFMFQLTKEEWENLKSQIVMSSGDENNSSQIVTSSNRKHRGSKYLPFAFAEGGVAMLSGLLNSDIAIDININIMRAFVAIRTYLNEYASTSNDISELKARVKALEDANNDNMKAVNDLGEDMQSSLDDIYIALSELANKQNMIGESAEKPRRPIGYVQPNDNR